MVYSANISLGQRTENSAVLTDHLHWKNNGGTDTV